MKERDLEAKENPWVSHHVKAVSLREIFLRGGRLASLSTVDAGRPAPGSLRGTQRVLQEVPEQPVEGARDPECAGK